MDLARYPFATSGRHDLKEKRNCCENCRPYQRHLERLAPAEAKRSERAASEDQPTEQRDTLDDRKFIHAATSSPSYPTVTPAGTSSHNVR